MIPRFKTSKDLSFCLRNQALARNREFEVVYFIPFDSISLGPDILSFSLQSPLETLPFLKGEISILSNSSVHLYIDEIAGIHQRYKIPTADIISIEKIPFTSTVSSNAVQWDFESHQFTLFYSPFSLEVKVEKKVVLKVNSKNFMNYERYREKDWETPHDLIKTIDATGIYQENMWEECFQNFIDEKRFGPSSVGLDFAFCETNDVYGIAEHTGALSLKDTTESDPYRLYNLDVFLYKHDSTGSIYGCIPFVYAKNVGVLWINGSETWVDIYKSPESTLTHFYSESGVIDLVIFTGKTPLKVVETYTQTTGPGAFPPLFALGYHQCRWNYYSSHEISELQYNFNALKIPVDTFWLDIEHTDQLNYFTWEPSSFPSPLSMLDSLAQNGKKLVTIIDPHFQIKHVKKKSFQEKINSKKKIEL